MILNGMTVRIMAQGEGRRLFSTGGRLNTGALAALERKSDSLPTERKRAFWVNVIRFLEFTIGTKNLAVEDRESIILSIKESDPLFRLEDLVNDARVK